MIPSIAKPMAAALHYASIGWHVIPLHTPRASGCSCGNSACGAIGKHPRTRHGIKDATTDPDVISRWWLREPDANIGIVTGIVSGIVVVDVDPRNGGCETWRWHVENYGCAETYTVETGRGDGGFHLYFAIKGAVKGRTHAFGQGVDLKGEGGYVVAPPSVHESGGQYFVRNLRVVSTFPDWTSKKEPQHTTHKKAEPSIVHRARAYIAKCAPSISGQGGHKTAFYVAQVLTRGFELSDSEAQEIFDEYNRTCLPPWSKTELAHKLSSARRDGDMPLGSLLNQSPAPAPPPPPSPQQQAKTKCLIEVTTDREHVVDQALESIADRPNLYQRKGMLVQVISDPIMAGRQSSSPRIRIVPQPWLAEKLSSAALWVKRGKADKMKEVDPPAWVPEFLLAREGWSQFEHLLGVSEVPVLRSDGSVHDIPGYDSATRIVYCPSEHFPPSKTTATDANEALARILDLVVDFPFQSDEHKSAWVAGLLSPFSRSAAPGPNPLLLIDANNKGTGKGKLADIIARIYLGRDVARFGQTKDAEEERKRITTIALEGDRMVLLDDIVVLGGKSLDAAITSTVWKDRILGSSASTGEIDLIVNWIATGNNVAISEDAGRRVLHVRLDSPEENPETRTGFKHANLLQFVAQNRGQLAADSLTILRSFILSGAKPALEQWGSFEDWSALVRGSLVWLGQPDPGLTREGVKQIDERTEAMRQILALWVESFGNRELSRGEIYTKIVEFRLEDIKSAFEEVGGSNLSTKTIGRVLAKMKNRLCGGKKLVGRHSMTGKVWCVV